MIRAEAAATTTLVLAAIGAFASGCAAGLHLEAAGRDHAPAVFRDPDLGAELELVALRGRAESPHVSSVALSLELHNRGAAPIELGWAGLMLIGPDHRMIPQASGRASEPLPPGARIELHLPLSERLRPGDRIELVLPTVVHEIPREYHFRARVRRGAP